MTLVLAHASHWLESVIYLVPIVGFAIWLGVATIKDKRRRASEPDADAGA